jgi:SAM-dependent methyltransferase
MTKALDLGCGKSPKNFFGAHEVFGVDVREDLGNNIVKVDLALDSIPFKDEFFDYVTAHDVIEHIPRVIYAPNHRYPFIELMNEIWRCLKINGQFLSVTPSFPHPAAFVDPTHVNIITEQTFPLYFDDENCWARGYGFKGSFKIISQHWQGAHLISVLQKVAASSLLSPNEVEVEVNSKKSLNEVGNLATPPKSDEPLFGAESGELLVVSTTKSKTADDLHQDHWSSFFESELHERLYHSWFDDGTVNHWRHVRFLEAPLSILDMKRSSWLVVGDGGGHDSWILGNAGYSDVLSTDIGDRTLKRCFEENKIQKFEPLNAEKMHYQDDSFEFVLCKDALHHMRRPYSAIYEMLRVATRAVVIIEPQDFYIDTPALPGPAVPTWERVGNYVYGFSIREFQKIAYGLNLSGLATKNMCDVYIEGCEFQRATAGDPFFENLKSSVAAAEEQCRRSEVKWNYVMTILFKVDPHIIGQEIESRLEKLGWKYEKTNLNPYLP